MGVTVSRLDGLGDVMADLRRGGRVLGRAADKVGDVQGVFVEQVEKPLCAGRWWSGAGRRRP